MTHIIAVGKIHPRSDRHNQYMRPKLTINLIHHIAVVRCGRHPVNQQHSIGQRCACLIGQPDLRRKARFQQQRLSQQQQTKTQPETAYASYISNLAHDTPPPNETKPDRRVSAYCRYGPPFTTISVLRCHPMSKEASIAGLHTDMQEPR